MLPKAEKARIELDSSVDVSKQTFTISSECESKSITVFTGDKELKKDELKTFIDAGDSDVKVQKRSGEVTSVKEGLSGGAIAGIVIACVVVVAAVVVVIIVVLKKKSSDDSPPV